MKDEAAARQTWQQVVALDRTNGHACYALGIAEQQEGHWEAAEAWYRRGCDSKGGPDGRGRAGRALTGNHSSMPHTCFMPQPQHQISCRLPLQRMQLHPIGLQVPLPAWHSLMHHPPLAALCPSPRPQGSAAVLRRPGRAVGLPGQGAPNCFSSTGTNCCIVHCFGWGAAPAIFPTISWM